MTLAGNSAAIDLLLHTMLSDTETEIAVRAGQGAGGAPRSKGQYEQDHGDLGQLSS